jgi:hypothetical protein
MVEESEKTESPQPEKLLIDKPSDFQFHAAYLTYSDIYDKATSNETKEKLNQNILALQQNQMDYSSFYRNIGQYREENVSQHRYPRTAIKTQRKQEWRRKEQKRERIKRHKK